MPKAKAKNAHKAENPILGWLLIPSGSVVPIKSENLEFPRNISTSHYTW